MKGGFGWFKVSKTSSAIKWNGYVSIETDPEL